MKNSSVDRVRDAALYLGLPIKVKKMPISTRTAKAAAVACRCGLSQIVKSLVFTDISANQLILFLISGSNQLDLVKMDKQFDGKLERSDPNEVRKRTGFAIGGVAPIGHVSPIPVFIDTHLFQFNSVWAAAGSPNSVFEVDPKLLAEKTNAVHFSICPNVDAN